MEIEEMEAMIARTNEIIAEQKRIKAELLDPLGKELSSLDGKIAECLDQMEVKSFKSKYGSVTKNTRYSYKVPKNLEDKQKFFKWLHERKGSTYYWEKVNIASASLGAIAKEEIEIAKEEGNYDFEIPGLSEPTATTYISRRK